ncbi:MAG: polymer-forming cytoskeletal protein [Patescibacteria group bacterium]|jgi:cytoskeletal protein CcmA (bactofilin family)
MFKKNVKPIEDEVVGGAENNETIVGSSVKLEGDLISTGNISVYGDVVGQIVTERDVTIGDTATIKANISGENVTVGGRVEGNVKASGKLSITGTGKIFGDVVVSSISISDGAMFSGHCQMGIEESNVSEEEQE